MEGVRKMGENIIDDFLEKKNVFAVIGVSRDVTKYGRKVFDDLRGSGFKVFPLNPKADIIDGQKCYASLEDLPVIPDVVVFVVPPVVGEKLVIKCKKLGIKNIWLQPGSESETLIKYCSDNSINCVHDQCVMIANDLK